ncbi:hypothetical protein [Roseovarius sp. SYSU LYC5161]|uniref:hypothetical protein n=1 Tax=Roseovarius halophilus (ex Wu et al. 2025) TaxID=3376060 RepID=UPI00399A2121
MTRVPRLTLLAPDIVEAILDGVQGAEVTLARVLGQFPLEWNEQMLQFYRENQANGDSRRDETAGIH